jgi:hypothetical protein
MKKRNYILVMLFFNLFFITNPDLTAYGQTGVYLTYADYKNGTLCYSDPCYQNDSHRGKFRFNELLSKKYLTIVGNDEIIKLEKDKVFAVKLCNGELVRFQKDMQYKIAEEGFFYIYYRDEMNTENKTIRLVRNYFFSTKPDGEILSLAMDNLAGAYPENLKFHEMLNAEFKCGDNDIASYDSQSKMFIVNKLFKDSL